MEYLDNVPIRGGYDVLPGFFTGSLAVFSDDCLMDAYGIRYYYVKES